MVRIWSGTNDVVGVGFLVGDRHVLTCAHVVARALGLPDKAPALEGAVVSLDFPLHASHSRCSATVVVWMAIQGAEGGDIAGLVLDGDPPSGVEPATLVTRDDLWKRSFRTFGFPRASPGGDWASGILLDTQAEGWLQIESDKLTGRRVQAGYSGAPLWVEDELPGVAGMVVAADSGSSDRVGYAIPASQLVRAWPDVLEMRAIPACPYRGLLAFRSEDSDVFFGRDDVIARLTEAAYRQSLIALVGPSGSGKSSVVLAGMLAEIRRRGEWSIAQFHPGSAPIEALTTGLIQALDWEFGLADYMQETSILEQELRRQGRLDRAVEGLLSRTRQRRMLIVADQFEELYTLCQDEHERSVFRDILLDGVARSAVHRVPTLTIVLTMRADFLNQALLHAGFADALQDAIDLLGPMTGEQLREAIERPAQARGVTFSDGLVDRILGDIGEGSGRLPLLEFALTQLWQRQQRRRLSHQAYRAVGGVTGALTQHAEQVFDSLSVQEQQAARRIFGQLVMPGDGTADTRRVAYRTDLREEDWPIVQRLADARLVVTDRDEHGQQERVQVAHEVLLEGWDRLRQWVVADRTFLVWRERMRTAGRLWEATEFDGGALLRGALLDEAEHWGRERPDELDERISKFIYQSRAAKAQELSDQAENLATLSNVDRIDNWKHSLAIFHDLGDLQAEAATLLRLASFHVEHRTEDSIEAALDYGNQSVAIFRQLGDRQAETATLKMLAGLHAQRGDFRVAIDSWSQGWRASSDPQRWFSLPQLPQLIILATLTRLHPLYRLLVVRPFTWLIMKPIELALKLVGWLVGAALLIAVVLFWYVVPPVEAYQAPRSNWVLLLAACLAMATVLATDGWKVRSLIVYPFCATVVGITLGITYNALKALFGFDISRWFGTLVLLMVSISLWSFAWWSYKAQWPAEAQPYIETVLRALGRAVKWRNRDRRNA